MSWAEWITRRTRRAELPVDAREANQVQLAITRLEDRLLLNADVAFASALLEGEGGLTDTVEEAPETNSRDVADSPPIHPPNLPRADVQDPPPVNQAPQPPPTPTVEPVAVAGVDVPLIANHEPVDHLITDAGVAVLDHQHHDLVVSRRLETHDEITTVDDRVDARAIDSVEVKFEDGSKTESERKPADRGRTIGKLAEAEVVRGDVRQEMVAWLKTESPRSASMMDGGYVGSHHQASPLNAEGEGGYAYAEDQSSALAAQSQPAAVQTSEAAAGGDIEAASHEAPESLPRASGALLAVTLGAPLTRFSGAQTHGDEAGGTAMANSARLLAARLRRRRLQSSDSEDDNETDADDSPPRRKPKPATANPARSNTAIQLGRGTDEEGDPLRNTESDPIDSPAKRLASPSNTTKLAALAAAGSVASGSTALMLARLRWAEAVREGRLLDAQSSRSTIAAPERCT